MIEWEGVEAGKKKHALLASLGQDAFDLLADATVPARSADKIYDELVQLTKQQLQPTKLPIAAGYEFYQLRQGNDVATYLCKLHAATDECAFSRQLEDWLRDQLVYGLASKDAVKKTLTEKLENLTLERATNTVTAYKAVQTLQQHMQGESTSSAICVLNKEPGKSRQRKSRFWRPPTPNYSSRDKSQYCDWCAKNGHLKANCHFCDQKCHRCGKIGHLKAACWDSMLGTSFGKLHALSDDEVIFAIGSVHFHKVVRINDKQVRMVFDVGADIPLINKKVHVALEGVAHVPLKERLHSIRACRQRNRYSGRINGDCGGWLPKATITGYYDMWHFTLHLWW